jgi:hypothetical protein
MYPWDSKYETYPWDSKPSMAYRLKTYAWDSKHVLTNRGIVNAAIRSS